MINCKSNNLWVVGIGFQKLNLSLQTNSTKKII